MTFVDPLKNPKNFLFKTWRTLGLPDPSPLQYDFMEYVNDHRAWAQLSEEVSKAKAKGVPVDEGVRKILMAFRGAAKTYVVTTNSVYRLRENQLEEVLVVSATGEFASAISTMAFGMVTKFDWLAGDMAPTNDQRQSALSFDVRGARAASKDASFSARGIFGQITGLRSTLIMGDDLETPNTSETDVKRTQLRHRMSELGGAIIKPGGDIILCGTAQNEQTIYKEYADEKGYELRIYPIVYPKVDEVERRYGTRLAPSLQTALDDNPLLAGTSTEPNRFNERDIIKRKMEWGDTEFERQFKMWLDAGADRAYPLKLRDLIVFEFTPPNPSTGNKLILPAQIVWAPMRDHRLRDMEVDSLPGDGSLYAPLSMDIHLPADEVICQIDPSGEGQDETSWAILAGLSGRIYFAAQGSSKKGHTEEVMMQIAADCATWGVTTVKVESNFGQGMFSSLLMPHLKKAGCRAEVISERAGSAQKEKRIVGTLEPLITSHRLVVNAGVFRNDFRVDYKDVEEAKRRFYRLTYQLTRITKVKGALRHDDRVESLSAGCEHFSERLQKALDEEQGKSKDEAIQAEAEKMVEARLKMGLPVVGWLPEGDGFERNKKGHDRGRH
jgi:hypothetical protein